MACLSPAALRKYERLSIFRNKILNQEVFSTTEGDVILENCNDNLNVLEHVKEGKKTSKLKTICGKLIALSLFIKTPEFKSGESISGAGSDIADYSECLQCYSLSALLSNKPIDCNSHNITCYTTSNYHTSKANLDDSWMISVNESAKQISKYLDRSLNYTIHRGSPLVNSINECYNRVNDTFIQDINKWNPSDIWIVSDCVQIDSMLSSCNTIYDLNNIIKNGYETSKLIGVSLKKVTTTPYVKVVNYDKIDHNIKIEGYRVTRGEFLSDSKDVYVNFLYNNVSLSIQFRTSGDTSWQGEIKGKNANHGKAGFGIINQYLGNKLPKRKEVVYKFNQGCYNIKYDFYNLAKKYYECINISLEEFLEKELDVLYASSKYLGLLALDLILANPESLVGIVRYASSQTDYSSVFLKIEENNARQSNTS